MIIRIILLLFINIAYANDEASKINPATYAKRIILAVNKYRASIGKEPLREFKVMDNEATIHSNNMANHIIGFGHTDFDKRLQHIYANIENPLGASENVAYFPPSKSPEQVVTMWLTSRGHRHNIEGDYNLTGVGVVVDKHGWIYYTQEFAKDGNT